jgi:hypothetical protein
MQICSFARMGTTGSPHHCEYTSKALVCVCVCVCMHTRARNIAVRHGLGDLSLITQQVDMAINLLSYKPQQNNGSSFNKRKG